jgi:hypothetical protein
MLLALAIVGPAAAAGQADPEIVSLTHEARRAVSVINWFYADRHACPQPTHPAELKEFRVQLGDGFAAEPRGRFIAISGISMISGSWFYYASPHYPDRCTLWRRLDGDATLVWRRHRYGATWVVNPGDGTPERELKLAP